MSVGVHGDSGALVGIVNVSGLSLRFDAAARARAVDRMRALVAERRGGADDGSRLTTPASSG